MHPQRMLDPDCLLIAADNNEADAAIALLVGNTFDCHLVGGVMLCNDILAASQRYPRSLATISSQPRTDVSSYNLNCHP